MSQNRFSSRRRLGVEWLLLTVVVAGALANCNGRSEAAEAPPRKNVLFLIADDLNNSLGCYGQRLVHTPHLDQLAARGVRFDRAYCSFPLCGPSRNSMLTGLYPNSTGILANGQIFRQTIPDQPSLPQLFRQHGYFAARVGKLYHYNVPNSIGTVGHDDPASWEVTSNPAGADRMLDESKIFTLTKGQFGGTLSWLASDEPEPTHTDSLLATDAEWILERCARHRERPFFLAVGFYRPHTPYVAPKSYFTRYPAADMPLVTGVAEDQLDLPKAALASYKKEQDQLTDELRREAVQAYFASITFMDAQVGRVLAALDRLGLSDSTIVVFTSDHGYHLGEHGLWQKQSVFEENARVPLLIVDPRKAKRTTESVATPVSHVDLFPTLAALCGLTPPKNLQGQSLAPLLADPSHPNRGWALTQVVRGGGIRRFGASAAVGDGGNRFFGYSLRTARWRYTEWDEGRQGRELYDHEGDPRELTNLAEKPEQAERVTELSKQLRAAVVGTLPASGEIPAVKEGGLWAPNLKSP